jgi:hypothetical protein
VQASAAAGGGGRGLKTAHTGAKPREHLPFSEQIFERGPFLRLLELLGTGRPAHNYARGAIIIALLAWLPMPILAFVDDGLRIGPGTLGVLNDPGAYARCLVALPTLVLADLFCGGRLTAIARYFLDAGLIEDPDRKPLQALLVSSRRWSSSPVAAIVILVLLLIITMSLFHYLPRDQMPGWNGGGTLATLTRAGWWHALVSTQLLLALLLGWVWRLLVWTRFLTHLTGFRLKLSAAHPDKAGGLLFLGHSIIAFAPVGFAVGAVYAGLVANHVWHMGKPLMSFRNSAATLIFAVLVIFALPLTVFMRRLAREWTLGIQLYGHLASRFAGVFEDKWFRQEFPVDPRILDASDFSAAIDLSSYAQNAYQMRVYPADIRSFIFLAAMTVLPLVPVIVFSIPLTSVLDTISNALF